MEPRPRGVACPLSQGEPYYLASAFKNDEVFKHLKVGDRILNPVIDFSGGSPRPEKA